MRAYFDLAEQFQPDVVISDFESWSYLFGRNHGLPVISVDNMQIIDRCTHAPEILAGHEADFQLTKADRQGQGRRRLHYHITTFFYPPSRKPRTTLHPPILRPEILAARRGAGRAPARLPDLDVQRRRCRRSWRGAGASAASTACAAT